MDIIHLRAVVVTECNQGMSYGRAVNIPYGNIVNIPVVILYYNGVVVSALAKAGRLSCVNCGKSDKVVARLT